MTRILVLGASRSGKSRFAESLLADEPEVAYVATADDRPDDPEWTQRIRRHRERRPSAWRTVETDDVAAVLDTAGSAVLVDSVTTWLAGVMGETGCLAAGGHSERLAAKVEALCSAWTATQQHVVVVSDEVGGGVVPPTESGRRFRDALGLLNQRLAAVADEVHLVVAGIPLRLR